MQTETKIEENVNKTDERLKKAVELIERLSEEKSELSEQINAVYKDLKEKGYIKKAVRDIVKEKKLDRDERAELEEAKNSYRKSLQMEMF